MSSTTTKTDAQWRAELSAETYRVTRRGGTERPFSHPYCDDKREGIYECACCGLGLFSSASKYDSGTGWPSFHSPHSSEAIAEREDRGFFMRRIEVLCSSCDAHLGHVFPDGPPPSGRRYCINGAALRRRDVVVSDSSPSSSSFSSTDRRLSS